MQRRTYLRGVAALGVAAGAGCLGNADPNPNVALDEPDRQFESADVPYPAWGQQIPDATLPAPLDGRDVALRSVETPQLLTFFYSNCQTVCPALVSALRNVQTHALNSDYGDQVSFAPITFDPARDDADRLRTYAKTMHVDADAGDWHFLRPQSAARAKQVVQEQFGLKFEKQPPKNGTYMFVHAPLILLVNADSYVERAYRTKSPDTEQMIDDLATVRSA
ncbi:MAG: SCO family protein [Haloarculaceae archaeon]